MEGDHCDWDSQEDPALISGVLLFAIILVVANAQHDSMMTHGAQEGNHPPTEDTNAPMEETHEPIEETHLEPEPECCDEKTVGSITSYLVGTGETDYYKCLDNCIYHSRNPRDVNQYCFRTGTHPVSCIDATVTPTARPTRPTRPPTQPPTHPPTNPPTQPPTYPPTNQGMMMKSNSTYWF